MTLRRGLDPAERGALLASLQYAVGRSNAAYQGQQPLQCHAVLVLDASFVNGALDVGTLLNIAAAAAGRDLSFQFAGDYRAMSFQDRVDLRAHGVR